MRGRGSLLALVVAASAVGGCGAGEAEPIEVLEPRTTHELVFRHPDECRECHPTHVEQWEGSMHAYSATDPVFHALNQLMADAFLGEAGDFCTQCHTPPGFLGGETDFYTDEDGRLRQRTQDLSPVAQAGVSCDVCHSIVRVNEPANARFEHRLDGTIRGPFADAMPNDFHESVESPLHRTGELCSGCHNVDVPVTDEDMLLENTGREFDAYLAGGGDEQCQDCHMPATEGQAAVDGPVREIHAHTFVGVDVALVDFPHRDEQRALVAEMLRSAVLLDVVLAPDATSFTISLTNQAGHAVPSGSTAERRMWIAATVTHTGTGAVVYSTGHLDDNGDLMDGFEKHTVDPDGDPDLWWFGSILRDFDDEPTVLITNAESIEEHLLAPHETATKTYELPALEPGDYELEVRVRFRAFQPFFLRALASRDLGLDPDLIGGVPTFDMAEHTEGVSVAP